MNGPPLPEWAPHEAVWIGFPSDPELWLGDLKHAEREVAAFAEAVHAGGKGETVRLVAAHDGAAESARQLAPFADVIVEPFGDIWLRDTGPIVVGQWRAIAARRASASTAGAANTISTATRTSASGLPRQRGLPFAKADWVLEGGAIDDDGTGTVVTTEQCLLNPNRNSLTREEIEERLRRDLGFERIVWLGSGLLNDHTDGHVDNLARFVAPGGVAVPTPAKDDPNAAIYEDARDAARQAPASRSSPCPRPAGSPARTATSSRRAT